MAIDPATMSDVKLVRQLMENAQKRDATELVLACQRRIFQLGGMNYDDPVEQRLWQAVSAYEETLRAKHGKAQQASYTRRKIDKKGAVVTLTDWALDEKMTEGFRALVDNGMAEFTGEYVVVEFSDRFEPHVVQAARKRLEAHGVKLPK